MGTKMHEVYRNRVTNPGLKNTRTSQSSSCTDDESDECDFEIVPEVKTKPSIKMTPNIQQSSPQKFKLPLSPLKRRESAKVHPIIPASTITNDIENCREEMDWAKRVFYLSTERIFPGFRKSSETKKIGRTLYSTRIRSSLPLAMLLLGNFYFNFMWAVGWVGLIGKRLSTLKKVHGGVLLGCSMLSVGINHLRIRIGIQGNSSDDGRELGIYWMMSALIQLPLVVFFLLTDFFSPTFFPLSTILDTISAIYLTGELIIGFGHLNSIITSELQVLRLAQETWKLTTRDAAFPFRRPSGLYYPNALSDSLDSESENICDSDAQQQSDIYDYIETVKSEELDAKKSTCNSSNRPRRVTHAVNHIHGTDGISETFRVDTDTLSKRNRKGKSKRKTMEEGNSSLTLTQESSLSHTNEETLKTLKSSTSKHVKKSVQGLSRNAKSMAYTEPSPVKHALRKHRKSSPKVRSPSSPAKQLLKRTSKSSEKLAGSSATKKSPKRIESSGVLTKTMAKSSPIKTKRVSQKISTDPILVEQTSVDRKRRNKIESATSVQPVLSTDIIISEGDTQSTESLPFSNLEEAEADYIYEMLSDNYSSTDDPDHPRLPKTKESGER